MFTNPINKNKLNYRDVNMCYYIYSNRIKIINKLSYKHILN